MTDEQASDDVLNEDAVDAAQDPDGVEDVRVAAAGLDLAGEDPAPVEFSVASDDEDDIEHTPEPDEPTHEPAAKPKARGGLHAWEVSPDDDIDAIHKAISGAAASFAADPDDAEPADESMHGGDDDRVADADDQTDAVDPSEADTVDSEPGDLGLVMDDLDAMLGAAQEIEAERSDIPEPDRNVRDFTREKGAIPEGIPPK